MTKILIDEAVVRQALEALEYWRTSPETCGFTYKARDATTAVRQALSNEALDKMAENARELGLSYEQPAPAKLCKYGNEPASCTSSPMDCQCAIDAAHEQAAQEPIAYAVYHRMGGGKSLHWPEQHSDDGDHSEYQLVPLYTTPPAPAQPWVGLTDEEVRQICGSVPALREAVNEAEAKLKERNT